MNKKLYPLFLVALILTSCNSDNSKIYTQDLKKLNDATSFSSITNFELDMSTSEDESMIFFKFINPQKILLEFKTIIAPSNNIKEGETYLNIGYFEAKPIAFNNSGTELEGYLNYKTLNFAYPKDDFNEFKVFVTFLNSANVIEEYFYSVEVK